MSIKIKCPHCGQKYNLPDEEIGADIVCAVCSKPFTTRTLAAPEPAAPPTPPPVAPPKPPVAPPKPPENRNLTRCSICGGNVSIHAATCPHCGNPLKSDVGAATFFAGHNTMPRSTLKTWLLGCTAKDGSFKNPLISEIFYYIGAFKVFLALLCVAAWISLIVVSQFKDLYISKHSVLFVGIALFINAIFDFGIAQIIHCIGKSCYNSDRIVDLMQAEAGRRERA